MPFRRTLLAFAIVSFGCSEVLVLRDDGGGGGAAVASSSGLQASSAASIDAASSGSTGPVPCNDELCALAVGFEASDLAIDDTHVYVTSRDDGAVRRVPKVGGAVEVVSAGAGAAHSLVVTEDWVLWGSDAGVWRSAKDQDTATLLAPVVGGAGAVSTDGWAVYFSSISPFGSIGSVHIDGGAVEKIVLHTVFAYDLGVESHAKDWPRLFWVSQDMGGGQLRRLYLDGDSEPETVLGGLAQPSSLLLTPEGVYVADFVDGSVVRENTSGIGRALATGLAGPAGLAVDDALLYVTVLGGEGAAGSIIALGRARATGILPIAEGLEGPTAIAADDDAIYWIEASPERAIMRLLK